MRLEGLLEQSAARTPDKVALVAFDKRFTYAELDALATKFANVLLDAGMKRGERVIVYLDNSVESAISIFGTVRANGIFSMVNAMTKAQKLAYIVTNLKPRFVVTEARLLAQCEEAIANAPWVERVFVTDAKEATSRTALFWAAMDASSSVVRKVPALDIDLAYVSYTSGSTGVPKGVMMTHQSSLAGTASMVEYLGITSEERTLSVVPLSFDYGLYQVIMSVATGGTLYLEGSFAFPNKVMKKVAAEAITAFPLVPTIAAIIVGLKTLTPGGIPSLRLITNTAAPLPPAHSARLLELFPGCRIFSNYGLTETIRSTYLPPEELTKRPTSVGKAMPNTEATIVDPDGKPVPAGVEGELVIRGGNLLKGYWENAEATEKVLKPGVYPWEKTFHTGDVFVSDEDGFLYFKGRKDDVIKSRGEKVAPREVEDVLYQMKGVREAAVFGVPDPIQGMAVRAVLALEPDVQLKPQEVQVHCAKYLEEFMVPTTIEFRAELPKTESGKIKRRELADEAAAALTTK